MARAAKDDTSPDDRGGRIAQMRTVWGMARAPDSGPRTPDDEIFYSFNSTPNLSAIR